AVAAEADRRRSGRDDAISRLLDALEGLLDAPGCHRGIAAVDKPEPRANVIVGELGLERTHEARLLPNRMRTLPCPDTKQMGPAIEWRAENRRLRGAQVVTEGRTHERERAAMEFRVGKFGSRWAHEVTLVVRQSKNRRRQARVPWLP